MILLFFIAFLTPIFAQTEPCDVCLCRDEETFILDCTNRNLTSEFTDWPTQKPLRAIMAGNNFTTLDRLPLYSENLEINLSNCHIQMLESAIFSNCEKTTFVDLSYNYLTAEQFTSDTFRGAMIGREFQKISLQVLDLSYNQIHSLKQDVFEFTPNLTRLNLEGNDFKVLDIHTQLALSSATKLNYLNLANNELTELEEEAIKKLKNLIELDLSKNNLDFVPKSLQVVGKSLQKLILDANPIIWMDNTTFIELPNLTQLSADHLSLLKVLRADTFAHNYKLGKLSISNCRALSFVEDLAFGKLSMLRELYLVNNNLTSIPYTLLNWSQLDIFDISKNPLICDCPLFRISSELNEDITRDKNGPTCRHPVTHEMVEVYRLTSDICDATARPLFSVHTNQIVTREWTWGVVIGLVILIKITAIVITARNLINRRKLRELNKQRRLQNNGVVYTPLSI